MLARHGVRFEVINVDSDTDLCVRYDQCVPVVVIDGRERFRGRVDPLLLRRILAVRQDGSDAVDG